MHQQFNEYDLFGDKKPSEEKTIKNKENIIKDDSLKISSLLDLRKYFLNILSEYSSDLGMDFEIKIHIEKEAVFYDLIIDKIHILDSLFMCHIDTKTNVYVKIYGIGSNYKYTILDDKTLFSQLSTHILSLYYKKNKIIK